MVCPRHKTTAWRRVHAAYPPPGDVEGGGAAGCAGRVRPGPGQTWPVAAERPAPYGQGGEAGGAGGPPGDTAILLGDGMGTDEIRAIVLNPTGTRQEVRAELRDKSVELRGEGGKLVTISRNDVFPWHEPVRVEWLPPHVPQRGEGEGPPPAFSVALQPPVFSEGRRFIVVGHNDFTPIRYEADLDNEAARREASVIKQISRMATAQKEAQRRGGEGEGEGGGAALRHWGGGGAAAVAPDEGPAGQEAVPRYSREGAARV